MGEKAGDQVCLDGIDQFHKYSFVLHATSVVIGKKSQLCMAGKKLCLWRPIFIFCRWNTSVYLYLLRIIIRIVFFSNIFIKPENINEKSQPCMTRVCSPGKFLCLLKQWRILKLQTQLSSWIVFTTKMIFYKNKLRYHSDSKIQRHFFPATIAGYPKLNGFFCACRYFRIKCCSARSLTTIWL